MNLCFRLRFAERVQAWKVGSAWRCSILNCSNLVCANCVSRLRFEEDVSTGTEWMSVEEAGLGARFFLGE